MQTKLLEIKFVNQRAETPPSRYRERREWERECKKHMRVYFSVESESIAENFIMRRARPSDLYRTYLPDVFDKVGLPRTTKARWDAYAGCAMCPCSPGFVVKTDTHKGYDVWVTLQGGIEAQIDPSKIDPSDIKSRVEAINRVGAEVTAGRELLNKKGNGA